MRFVIGLAARPCKPINPSPKQSPHYRVSRHSRGIIQSESKHYGKRKEKNTMTKKRVTAIHVPYASPVQFSSYYLSHPPISDHGRDSRLLTKCGGCSARDLAPSLPHPALTLGACDCPDRLPHTLSAP